ncbi:hypothetical protein KFE25_010806 [Diacronema lutheri]|uniref:Uncharacterized protein n=1 Tax=Diacronema lutheri TaxID=2081491 RepID=A0A8J5X4I7_DIALT|nr:hypothetical protein KFE25_010806 [Diacronema lutheri]
MAARASTRLAALLVLSASGAALRQLPARAAEVCNRRGHIARMLAPAALSLVALPARSPAAQQWISGRNPGGKPKDGDVTGTKRDPKYLRCLNNCLPSCIGGPSGVQKDKSTCLQECQDECCSTYAQCSYAAVKAE